MARNIDTALLRAFVAVVETGGMTRAGQLLNLTQAAISQQVKRLEDLFQAQLFEREKRTVHLTPEGERLLPLAERMLETNDQVWGAMTAPDFEGEVHLGVPYDIVKAFMPPILKSFNRAWACPTPANRARGRHPTTAGVRQPFTLADIPRGTQIGLLSGAKRS